MNFQKLSNKCQRCHVCCNAVQKTRGCYTTLKALEDKNIFTLDLLKTFSLKVFPNNIYKNIFESYNTFTVNEDEIK